MEEKEITTEDRKKYFEEVMNPGLINEIINRKKVFPEAGRYILEAALREDPIPEHDLELNDLSVKWLNFCIQSTKEFKERDFRPDPENEHIKEWEEGLRRWKRGHGFSHFFLLNNEPRGMFDFSPIEQY